ncbi:hypothetical protein LCGC14_1385780 [marine sediment metagenome]|uniref:Methyltransferase type 12 domain-containing protein n=1 Tax=marine sediment metagenome TaxID=412755 RepID=A0A0F9K1H0_9ZZZZ
MWRKITKAWRDPIGVVKRRISPHWQLYKYRAPDGYQHTLYWTDRLGKYGFDLRGVGFYDLSHEENREIYGRAKRTFIDLCCEQEITFKNVSIVDIGCGTGFYARTFFENGGTEYLGIDVTDILFPRLRQEFPQFEFRKLDISTHELAGRFDLIIMIDVTQHITNDDKFHFAMQNVKLSLTRNGVFIVTSWLADKIPCSFYEVGRPMIAYKREFPGYAFRDPIPFRDKFIFTIRQK